MVVRYSRNTSQLFPNISVFLRILLVMYLLILTEKIHFPTDAFENGPFNSVYR